MLQNYPTSPKVSCGSDTTAASCHVISPNALTNRPKRKPSESKHSEIKHLESRFQLGNCNTSAAHQSEAPSRQLEVPTRQSGAPIRQSGSKRHSSPASQSSLVPHSSTLGPNSTNKPLAPHHKMIRIRAVPVYNSSEFSKCDPSTALQCQTSTTRIHRIQVWDYVQNVSVPKWFHWQWASLSCLQRNLFRCCRAHSISFADWQSTLGKTHPKIQTLHLSNQKVGLSRHINIHHFSEDSINDYHHALSCRKCGAMFDNLSKLKSHLVNEHAIRKAFACSTCGKEFFHHANLKVRSTMQTSPRKLQTKFTMHIFTMHTSNWDHVHVFAIPCTLKVRWSPCFFKCNHNSKFIFITNTLQFICCKTWVGV